MPKKLKLQIDFTKSPKCDNIYKLRLWILEEHNYLILLLLLNTLVELSAKPQPCDSRLSEVLT